MQDHDGVLAELVERGVRMTKLIDELAPDDSE
jgi:hypothetical protein